MTEVVPEYSADIGSRLGNVYKIRTINYEEHRHPSIPSSCIYSTTTCIVEWQDDRLKGGPLGDPDPRIMGYV